MVDVLHGVTYWRSRAQEARAKQRRRQTLGVACWSAALALLCFATWSAVR
jgi:hypothetical protein